MTDQEKQKYYGTEAFETIYEKTKKDYVPQQMSYTPLDEKTLADRIGAALRPVYEKAIAAIFRGNKHADAELDADAISRGMGSSTFVSDLKRRQDNAAADDVKELESDYGAKLADQLNKAMEGERDRLLEVEKFNAQQRSLATEQAFSAAKTLYDAYLEAKAAQEAELAKAGSGGGGGGTAQKAQTSTAEIKTSLAQAVASARGQVEADPNGPAFYAKGNTETVKRVVTSDLPKYVKMRAEMNGDHSARQLEKYRVNYAK